MLKAKPRATRRFWETLSDEQLLAAELTTDDPEGLPGLVRELPGGGAEPYVEYKYDLRGSERESLHCVHGNHAHLAGFVMRKRDDRFLVGHICGKTIYGEDFEGYTADFDAAVNRQEALRRRREIEQATKPFIYWLKGVMESPVFEHYRSVGDRVYDHMQWIYDNLPRAALIAGRQAAVKFPSTLFGERTDPELSFGKAAAEFNAAVMSLIGMAEQAVNIDPVKKRFEALLRRIEAVLDELKEVEDFFQPGVLTAVCALANEYDNPKKRKYVAGMLSITCKRQKKDDIVVALPRSFKVPDRQAIEAFRKALGGIAI